MIFLLDTNTFSDLMREDAKTEASLSSHSANNTIVICPIVRGEILFGIFRLPAGAKRQDLQLKAEKLFSKIPCRPIPESAADRYASAKVKSQQKGLSLDDNDLWIAATTLVIGATLVTRDKDFQSVDNLLTADWSV
jgi:predicted nucleic acid-binding protein